MGFLSDSDPELFASIRKELARQQEKLELIASENIVSPGVLEAVGSVLTNKYAEGYPGHRYYGGCEYVDLVEELARERAKSLFQCDYANVQPYSGSTANMGVCLTVLKPGETLMGMALAHGGHLTHGASVSFSGRLYRAKTYSVSRETERIDYQALLKQAQECRPRLIIAGASAYSRTLDFKRFREIADEVGAYLVVDMAHIAGLVAAGLHPSPLRWAHFTTTTTHKTLRGPRGGMILIGKDGENDMGIVVPKTGRAKRFSELIDSAIFPGLQGGPLLHVIAGKAIAFKEALAPSFKLYQEQILKNAKALAESLQAKALRIVSGGTDNHLFLVDLSSLGLSGREAETHLDHANITVNKNTIPFDTRSPFVTSGIRLGTPALTSRGMKEGEMYEIGELIGEVLHKKGEERTIASVRQKAKDLCRRFPIYEDV